MILFLINKKERESSMIKDYEIFNFNDEDIQNVILLTCTEDIYFLQDDIFDKLSSSYGNEFTVLVDLFVRNGFSYNRFISLKFKGKDNIKTLIVNPRDVSEKVKCEIRKYLKNHIDILNKSALSMNTIEFVKSS